MKCPYCNEDKGKVVDSRSSNEDKAIRRRRECLNCGRRFTTYERVEDVSMMVIKKDGRREPFSRENLFSGLLKACEKRPISMEELESLVDKIERNVQRYFDREVESTQIGEMVMKELQKLDEVAYVRFASVYRQFKDISQFMKEVRQVLKRQEGN